MFWFRLLPLTGIWSTAMEGRGGIPGGRRGEEARRSSGRTAAVPPCLRPSGRLSSLRRARASLALRYSPLPSGWISLDLVNYRSSSHRCRCVPFVKAVYQLSAPHPALLRPGPAGTAQHTAGSPSFFSFALLSIFFFFFFPPGLCPPFFDPSFKVFQEKTEEKLAVF